MDPFVTGSGPHALTGDNSSPTPQNRQSGSREISTNAFRSLRPSTLSNGTNSGAFPNSMNRNSFRRKSTVQVLPSNLKVGNFFGLSKDSLWPFQGFACYSAALYSLLPWIALLFFICLLDSSRIDIMPKQILGTSKLTYKFQVTIPKEVRERYGLRIGDILVFTDDNGILTLGGSIEK